MGSLTWYLFGMETLYLNNDVHVFYITVKSFPTGITDAFKALENLDPSICERPFYGIFHEDENGNMIYRAAVEERYKGEAETYGCNTFVISHGNYLAVTIKHFMKRIEVIPEAFDLLGKQPGIDVSFPAIEWYRNEEEVVCMVKLLSDKTQHANTHYIKKSTT